MNQTLSVEGLARCLHAASIMTAADSQGLSCPHHRKIAAQWAGNPVERTRWKRIAAKAMEACPDAFLNGTEYEPKRTAEDWPHPAPPPIKRRPYAWDLEDPERGSIALLPPSHSSRTLLRRGFMNEQFIIKAADLGTEFLCYVACFLAGALACGFILSILTK